MRNSDYTPYGPSNISSPSERWKDNGMFYKPSKTEARALISSLEHKVDEQKEEINLYKRKIEILESNQNATDRRLAYESERLRQIQEEWLKMKNERDQAYVMVTEQHIKLKQLSDQLVLQSRLTDVGRQIEV